MKARGETEKELRMRCLEAAAQPGCFNPSHKDGQAAAILESAQAFITWVLSEKKTPDILRK